MRYVFEKGRYPNHTELDDCEFPNDVAAILHAEAIGADYVWDAPDDRNPSSVWRRGVDPAPFVRKRWKPKGGAPCTT